MTKHIAMMKYVEDFCLELADRDPNSYFVGIDCYRFYMVGELQKKYPDRVIGAGISEQNAISMATGLALSGKNVYVFMIAAYATRRALDQFKFACYCNANIKVITTLSGISHPFAGFSHMAPDDITNMKNSPNLEIYSPHSIPEIEYIMKRSTTHTGPMYIADDRFGHSESKIIEIDEENGIALSNKGSGKNLCILYAGQAGYYLHHTILPKLKAWGVNPDIYSIFRLEPINREKIRKLISKYSHIVTFELRGEGALTGSIAEIIAENGLKVKFIPVRLQNENYDITGYVDYVADYYLKINTIDERIARFAKNLENNPIIKMKFKNDKLTYTFLNIPILKIKRNEKKIKYYLFGLIKFWKKKVK